MTVSPSLRLAYISRNVADLPRSVAFYCERLGFTPSGPAYDADPALLRWMGLPAHAVTARRLRYGHDEIELVEVGSHGRPYPAHACAADLAFQHFALRCVDIEAACARLSRTGCSAVLPGIITRPGASPGDPVAVRLPAASGGVAAFKFRDPDGHPLELIEFPSTPDRTNFPDKRSEGIDHSAISVGDTDRSIAFYTALPGFRLGVRQINQGPEQYRLDGLDAARVDVVAMQPGEANGMHLELLGYHSDATRPFRSMSSEAHRPADIASDRLVFETAAALPGNRQDGHDEFMTDPDGHFFVCRARDAFSL